MEGISFGLVVLHWDIDLTFDPDLMRRSELHSQWLKVLIGL